MLIIEDGTGKPDAQAYISAADLLTYATLRGEDISEYTEADLEAAIYVSANDFIDMFYTFKGELLHTDQGMMLPTDEVIFSVGKTQRDIVEANANAAILHLKEGLLVDTTAQSTSGSIKSETNKLDVLGDSVEYFEDTHLSTKFLTPIVDRLLKPYTFGNGVYLKVT